VSVGASLSDVLDLLGALLVLVGCFLCFAAALGLLRFPDVISRMHAATKPQTLGLIVLAGGVELSLRTWAAFGTLVLIAALQLATAPVSAHLVGPTSNGPGSTWARHRRRGPTGPATTPASSRSAVTLGGP